MSIVAQFQRIVFSALITTALTLAFIPAQAQETPPTETGVQLWHPHTGERQAALEALVEQFNAENEWGIIVTPASFENPGLLYDQIILQLTGAMALPHLAMIWPHEAALFDLSNAVLDLEPYINDAETGFTDEDWDDFLPEWEARTRNPFTGKVLGWSARTFTPIMAVNRAALAELGFDTPPQTQAELLEMACAFQGWSAGKFGVAHGFLIPTDAEVLFGLGGNPYDDSPSPQFTLSLLEPTLQTLIRAIQEGCASIVANSTEAIDKFAAGQTLFYFGSSSSLPVLRDNIALNYAEPFAWGVYSLPTDAPPLVFGPIITIFDHDAESNLAAWHFLQWFTSPEINAGWVAATGSLPVRAPATESLDFPQQQQAWELLERPMTAIPAIAGYDVIRLEIQFALERLLSGTTTLEDELPALETLINQILQDFAPLPETQPED